ncbi:ferritin-like domain-containing protein [Paractinoplanes ferrugineus]|uniref:DUF4439 domain-containing protein n=1 Tax=Paractinoplanes ferrugineus TaxID=113564 RepID=A0A919M791_9ACTN|nr:ferritin-like domain-containing protein [Actinoplanes ferrugineus]GIE09181.1 hypothetical protein Afe05nite_10210 [Actinoplanes ferrugineus]
MNDQIAAALAAEEAAIYAYGVLGVKLAGKAEVDAARAAQLEHRERRDWLVTKIAESSAAPPAAPAGYRLPFPVVDRATAVQLAVKVEDGVAQAWRPVLGVTRDADRTTALAAMTDAAVRACRWRRLASITPLTMPFPGKAE